jgi:hypothetical protein
VAAKTFDDMTLEEIGALTRSRYDRLCEAHDMGLSDEHPADRWAQDTEVLKAHRAACASDENSGLGPKTIQKRGTPNEEQALTAKAGAEDHAIRRSGHHDVEGQLALAQAKRSNPARVRAMNLAIKGLDRLK